MTHKNKLLLTLAGAAIIGGTMLTTHTAFAQTVGIGKAGPMSSLAEKIATRFNLNQEEVEAVFDEVREEHLAEMQAKYQAHLDQLVTDGEITEEQKQLIIAKHEELRSQHDEMISNFENMTEEQRRAAMESERQELEAWAEQNGIDLQYLGFMHKVEGGGVIEGGNGGPGRARAGKVMMMHFAGAPGETGDFVIHE